MSWDGDQNQGNQTVKPLTVGTVTTSGVKGVDSSYLMNSLVSYVHCSGNAHHFKCDHATTCRCGKATRIVEPPKCKDCGVSL
jgi:hypothetical protein